MESKAYQFDGVELSLYTGETVFQPNLTTRLLAETVAVPANSRVLDIGCGVGPIALIAARKGASEAYGTDIMAEAIELARRNAELNGLGDRVRFLQSDLFEGLQGERFDVIIDDVSGMADAVSHLSPWYPAGIPTGGPDGTTLTLAMLEQVRDHLRPGGTLYFPVLSLANGHRILDKAQELFGDCLESVAEKWIPFCDEFKEHLPSLEAMKEDGIIDFITKRSRQLWRLEIYRADS